MAVLLTLTAIGSAIRLASASIIRCRSRILFRCGVIACYRKCAYRGERSNAAFGTQSAAVLSSHAPHDSKARLQTKTNRRGSWRSHVHRTRLRSACSSSSLKLPMQTPFFWTGDARFLSRERKWGSHHAACMPQSTSHLCEKEEPSLERDSSFLFWYKISIAPEAYRKPRRLCLFLL